jgi:hypothetical protein
MFPHLPFNEILLNSPTYFHIPLPATYTPSSTIHPIQKTQPATPIKQLSKQYVKPSNNPPKPTKIQRSSVAKQPRN